ncbi:hypothetical protein SPHI_27430 [Sphingomonas jeddahensis]|uniref:Uncharacterized protein n=1 Tax=Sphingomonas jeddahensis TaxID=1915074 RepID=A0A1V2EQT0_9SPHN|nr:hypothetical protein SPHI_27430 [Sphingomonas jeddahensis]
MAASGAAAAAKARAAATRAALPTRNVSFVPGPSSSHRSYRADTAMASSCICLRLRFGTGSPPVEPPAADRRTFARPIARCKRCSQVEETCLSGTGSCRHFGGRPADRPSRPAGTSGVQGGSAAGALSAQTAFTVRVPLACFCGVWKGPAEGGQHYDHCGSWVGARGVPPGEQLREQIDVLTSSLSLCPGSASDVRE